MNTIRLNPNSRTMTTKDKLTLGCRFYSGEKTNPFFEELNAHAVVNPDLPPSESMTFEHDLPREKEEYLHEAAIVWLFESYWVREKMRGEIYYNFKENLQSELQAIKQIEDKDTPDELKAFLWNRYKREKSESFDDFKKWYKDFYQSRPTNRQTVDHFLSELLSLGESPKKS